MKRFQKIRIPKNGVLKLQYAHAGDGVRDICTAWGDGCSKRDSNLILHYFCSEMIGMEKSLIDDLVSRDYDLTTIKFSIEKKQVDVL